jgi:hypothetical protein
MRKNDASEESAAIRRRQEVAAILAASGVWYRRTARTHADPFTHARDVTIGGVRQPIAAQQPTSQQLTSCFQREIESCSRLASH